MAAAKSREEKKPKQKEKPPTKPAKPKEPKPINMQPVAKSSQVSLAGYDPDTQTLSVKFSSGGTYHYTGVERDTWNKLKEAESFGKFLQANIVGKYPHKKLEI